MGFFSKSKPKPELHILVQGLDIKHLVEQEMWEFEYKKESFFGNGTHFCVPSLEELDKCLQEIERLKPEMLKRIEKYAESNGDRSSWLKDLSYFISIDELVKERRYEVTWSGDDNWGDMQVDFVIEDGKIVDEVWGD